ncbi:MAG TPA: siderophore-interacting protein [Vineibacter sp.]|nr:siderophore-interacting protein [Vineibacter sp.]
MSEASALSRPAVSRHAIERRRHDLKMRLLTVRRVERITPSMVRVTLTGDDLPGFVSASFDDHVKLFFAPSGHIRPALPRMGPNGPVYPDDAPKPAARDYTPRRYDPATNELDIDFALHEAGPATDWAAAAQPGHILGVGGPRGSFVIPDDFDWYLLIGDETALPAIGRRLEELPATASAIVIAEVANAGEEQAWQSRAAATVTWLHRGADRPGSADRLDAAVGSLRLPAGDGYAWVAGESDVAKRLRRRLLDQHGLRKEWLRAAGYWKRGAVALHETHDD